MTKASRASILQSLRATYRLANQQATALVTANRRNPLMLIDLQGEIERAVIRAEEIAERAMRSADKAMRS
jgi:hypothetical protein